MHSIFHSLQHSSLVQFFVLAYGFSWCAYAPAIIVYNQTASLPPALLLLSVIGNFGPLFAALVLTWLAGGRSGLRALGARLLRWRVAWPWYVMAFCFEAVHLLATSGLTFLVTGRLPEMPDGYPLMAAPLVFAVIFITAGLAEEVGWRGYALPRLQARWSPLTASLLLGLVWALWHLPGTFLPDTAHSGRSAGEWLWYIAGVTAFTVVLTWVFNNTRGSVLLTMVLHTASNTTQAYLPSDVVVNGFNLDTITYWMFAGIVIIVAKMWRNNLSATTLPYHIQSGSPVSRSQGESSIIKSG